MSRKSNHTTKSPSGATTKPSSVHSDFGHNKMQRDGGSLPTPHIFSSLNTSQAQPNEMVSGKGSTSDTSCDGEADGDDGDGGDADSEDADDDDADAVAPSGRVVAGHGDQAGHITDTASRCIPAAGEKRKCRSETPGIRQQKSQKMTEEGSLRQIGSQNDNSDEDDYNGVDLISDSEGEEPTVEQLEEKVIIDSEEENDGGRRSSFVPSGLPTFSAEDWNGFELDDNAFLEDMPFFDEQMGHIESDILAEEIQIYNTTSFSQRFFDGDFPTSPPPTRRVRFVDPVVSRSEISSSVTSEGEPDRDSGVFLQRDRIGSAFREMIEGENNSNHHSLKDKDGFVFNDHDSGDEDSDGSCGNSSGYETDLGETTEEEDVPPSATTRPQSLLRRTSASILPREGNTTPTPSRRFGPTPNYRRGPTMGSWVADPTKPIAVVDSTGTQIVIYAAQRPVKPDKMFERLASSASSANTSPRASLSKLATTVNNSDNDPSDPSSQNATSPMFGSSPNLMMSGLLLGGHGSEHLSSGQVLGPPEAFFPFTNFGVDGSVLVDDDDDDEDEDDEDNLLNIEDFINFGEDTDESANEGDVAVKDAQSSSASSTVEAAATATGSKSPVSNRSPTQTLISHFDKGVVTAFRRNQYQHKTVQRHLSSGSPRRSDHPIKGGRHIAANTSLSPLKKRKPIDQFDTRNRINPAGVALKRRFLHTR